MIFKILNLLLFIAVSVVYLPIVGIVWLTYEGWEVWSESALDF